MAEEGEDESIYVAALRQLFDSLEPSLKQAGSLSAAEELLLNLEETDENFHRYDFVRLLRNRLERDLSPLVERLIEERGAQYDGCGSIPVLSEEVQSSAEFAQLSQSVLSTVRSASNHLLQSFSDNDCSGSHIPSTSDKITKFSQRVSDSIDNDSLFSSSIDCGDFVFIPAEAYAKLANDLRPGSSLEKRLSVLSTLNQIPHSDIVASENWSGIKEGLSQALGDEIDIIVEKSLKFHARMFATRTAHVTKEIYTSLSEHLIQYFSDSMSHMVSIDSGLDLGDKRNLQLLKKFRLLSQFQQELPSYWIRYPEKLVEEILDSTVKLLSVIPEPLSGDIEQNLMTPMHFLTLIDPLSIWFKKWMHGHYSRAELIKQIFKSKKIVEEACKSCLDFALHCKTELAFSVYEETDDVNPDEDECAVYCRDDILCAYFVHSLSILGRLILYKEGRKLFPIELKERLETVYIPDLIVSIVETMCSIHVQEQTNFEESDFHPALLAAKTLKNIMNGSADACKDCLCRDTVTTALLTPVQKWLDGLCEIKTYSSMDPDHTYALVADVLALLASTEHGKSQILYGEKQDRWKRTRMAPIHTVSEFVKKALQGKLDPQPSQRIINGFLFVCRQLYNTCEGLMILSSYGLNKCVYSALERLMRNSEVSSRIQSVKHTIKPQSPPKCEKGMINKPLNVSPQFVHKHTSRQSVNSSKTLVHNTSSHYVQNTPGHDKGNLLDDGSPEADNILTTDDLVTFSRSMAASLTELQSGDIKERHEKSLLDNLLNFASTPKGVLHVQQTGSINECAEYMYSRYKQNLQVSKIEKFGYGVMMTQIAATAPGMISLENTGLFKTFLEDIWLHLEGFTNDYHQTVLTPYADELNIRQSKKLLTFMANLLSAFPGLYELLSKQPIAPPSPDIDTSEPVTSISGPLPPANFQEFLSKLILIDTSNKARMLSKFEDSHLFGLRALSILTTCLDSLLLLETRYLFQEILLSLQADCKLEGTDGFIIDSCSVERNQVLVRNYLIGGPTERNIPERTLTEDPENPYPWTLFASYPTPAEYSPQQQKVTITAFEQQDEIGKFLAESASNVFNSLIDAHEWLNKLKDVFVNVISKEGDKVTGKVAAQLLERVCQALCQDPEEAIFPLVEYSGNEALLKNILLSDMEELGLTFVLRYGIQLRILQQHKEIEEDLRHLLKQCKYFLRSQQRTFESSMQSLRSDYVGFDWFVSTIYLLNGGNTGKAWNFLYKLSSLVVSGYIWMARLHSSLHLPTELTESGIHPVYSSVCHNLELILEVELPEVYSAFRMSGYPPSQICQHWLRQCFWNYLDWPDICLYICTCLLMGIDYQVYFCLAIFKHLKRGILLHTQERDLVIFLKEEPLWNFHVGDYIIFMREMEQKYRSVILTDLQNITKP